MAQSPRYQYETVKVQVFPDGVAHVELNRPKRLNAFNHALIRDILQAFTDIGNDSNIRAVVLSGSGRLFTAGLDLMEGSAKEKIPEDLDVARKAFAKQAGLRHFQNSISSLEKCPKPVIVALHNGVIGAGVDLCTAGDIRYGTKDSYYCVKEVDVGLAADVGTLQRLPKVIGNASLIRELAYTSRNMYAEEALQCGLISKIFETKEKLIAGALETARLIASKSPVAVVSTKHLLNYSRDHSVDEGLQYTAVWNGAMLNTEDIPKSVEAFMKKKPAVYANL
ncbi:ClpP/crotonase-like domain-containing protein [Zychaea mexicana]|uniref:ClpP/crotonase-like domain-containing protein n=1 Tax=Zychaea mexicana TaxID=64656 RepID=UPI0022FEAC90|nr:ClpP/crotonase-like domain-containing protein [Zychaea mexicana]KAI9493855.1 ClpP/crotonase-like domain-containing protein [Zychaea mexicana]